MSAITPAPHKFSAARWEGLRVGILGGSFNPAHAGHMHIAREAMIRLKLHAIWWVVSPGNPLKTKEPLKNFEARVETVARFIKHPRMVATGIEGELGTRFTADTLKAFKKHFPRTQFVWIAGMDNASSFHRWDRWASLPHIIPFVFFDRPPQSNKLAGSRLRQNKRLVQRTKLGARALHPHEKGVFWMLSGKALNMSSTDIRSHKKPVFGQTGDSGVY